MFGPGGSPHQGPMGPAEHPKVPDLLTLVE
jgi:hypothetical protein